MSWDGKDDRAILIETATTVREMKESLDKRDQEELRVRLDVESRVRSLERLRWVVWGALCATGGTATELIKHLVGKGK